MKNSQSRILTSTAKTVLRYGDTCNYKNVGRYLIVLDAQYHTKYIQDIDAKINV